MLNQKQAKELIQKAKDASRYAYAPYSHLKVGAALLTKEDIIWTGCNVENVSYGLTICAERTAISKAISEGSTHFKAIAIVINSKKSISPCGACRQVLNEFNADLWIITLSSSGKIIQRKSSKLLPDAFSRSPNKNLFN